MQGCEGDLRGADQEEVVLWHLVDLVAVAGQEAGPDQRLLADEHGRDHRLVALAAGEVEREADQGELEQDQVALDVGESGAGELGGGLDVDQAEVGADLEMVAGLEVEARPLPDLAQGHGVLLGHPVGGVGVGEVGDRAGDPLQLLVDLLQLGLAGLDRLLQALDPGDEAPPPPPPPVSPRRLLGEGLALRLGGLDLAAATRAGGRRGRAARRPPRPRHGGQGPT